VNRYRVFISYSHENRRLAERVVAHLEALGMTVLWDKTLAYGSGFAEQIKAYIAHSHVFLPIITPESSPRGWVHQEIGFATAMNVPVLPVTVGGLPGEMMHHLHAVRLGDAEADLGPLLKADDISLLVDAQDDPSLALYACADEHEDRAIMMYAYAMGVRRLGYAGLVRQRAGLGSFHIPNRTLKHPAWQARYHPDKPRGEFQRRLARRERIALEWHAERAGCKLIVVPEVTFAEHGPAARIARLDELIAFLHSMPDDKIDVAHGVLRSEGENHTLVGDWFAAASIVGRPSTGYRQTIFTRHAPTVRARMALFDQEFAECEPWPDGGPSRQAAIAFLERLTAKLRKELAGGEARKNARPPKR
jgi:hypothetical protein